MSKLVESPIEQQMLDALRSVCWRRLVVVEGIDIDRLRLMAAADQYEGRVFVAPQLRVGPYRADFILASYRNPMYPTVVCVECDGHEFHRASIDQRARDGKRDLWMRGKMIETLRFSGKQIMRDSFACARKAISEVTRENDPNQGFETPGDVLARALGSVT